MNRLMNAFLFLNFALLVACNTEIINFGLSDGLNDMAIPINLESAPLLNSHTNEIDWVLRLAQNTPDFEKERVGDLWLRLNLDGHAWMKETRFTIRISWPACYPTDFSIELYSSPSERVKFAHIHATHSGVLTPPATLSDIVETPFTVILEPLYFGFLPQTVGPTLIWILVVAALAVIANGKILPIYHELGKQARKEIVLKSLKK